MGRSSHSPCHKLTSGRTEIEETFRVSSVVGLARQRGLTGVGGNASVPAFGHTPRLAPPELHEGERFQLTDRRVAQISLGFVRPIDGDLRGLPNLAFSGRVISNGGGSILRTR